METGDAQGERPRLSQRKQVRAIDAEAAESSLPYCNSQLLNLKRFDDSTSDSAQSSSAKMSGPRQRKRNHTDMLIS